MVPSFEWDPREDAENPRKHGVAFVQAQLAFLDPSRVITKDLAHGSNESLLLLRRCSGRRSYCPFHVPGWGDSDHWRRLVAPRSKDL
jgi:hypothetical protein